MKTFLSLTIALMFMLLAANMAFPQETAVVETVTTVAVEKAPLVPIIDGVVQLPEWVGSIIEFLKSVPYVGPVLVQVLKWIGIIASIFTALSLFLQAFCSILVGAAGVVKAKAFADWVSKVSGVILPWLKYLSMFNVKK